MESTLETLPNCATFAGLELTEIPLLGFTNPVFLSILMSQSLIYIRHRDAHTHYVQVRHFYLHNKYDILLLQSYM